MNYKASNYITFLLSITSVFISSCNYQIKQENTVNDIPQEVKSNIQKVDSIIPLKFTSMIRVVFEDRKGNLWFGSDQEGAAFYDGKEMTYFSVPDGLSNNQVRSIQEDQQGNIWFRTGYGISSFDGKKMRTHDTKPTLPIPLQDNYWQKTPDDIWVGNGDHRGGVFRIQNQTLTYLKFPTLDRTHRSYSINGAVTDVCYGKNDRVWIASYGGVIGFEKDSFLFINEKQFQYHVRSIFEDSKGNLWIGNNGIGVLCYDGTYTTNITEKYKFQSPRHVFAIAEDKDGNIWFGDRDTGAWKFNGEKFTNYTFEDGLTNNFVRAIHCDRKGNLWMGLTNGKVVRFRNGTFECIFG